MQPAKPGSTHLPPQPRRRSSCLGCCQTFKKDTGLSRLRPAASETNPARPCSSAWQLLFFPRLAHGKAQRHHRTKANCGGAHRQLGHTPQWQSINNDFPSSWTWAPKSMSRTARFVLTRLPASGATFSDPTTTTQKSSICVRCTVVAKDVEGTAHRQERGC